MIHSGQCGGVGVGRREGHWNETAPAGGLHGPGAALCSWLLAVALALMGLAAPASNAQAQLARKPAGLAIDARGGLPGAVAPDPAPWLDSVPDRAAFDRMARVFEIAHLLFLIDRADGNKVYFINTRRYALHEQFIRAHLGLANASRQALNDNYLLPDRRFLLGTLGWQPTVKQWSYEFWEGDRLTPELLKVAEQALGAQFFAPLAFKANASQQEAVAAQAALPFLSLAELVRGQDFIAMNPGTALGRLRVLDDLDEADELEPDDILVLNQVPLSLPPVAGVVTARPSTTLSHVNLLVKSWGIPSAYVRETAVLTPWNGRWVQLTVTAEGYQVQAAPEPSVRAGLTDVRHPAEWPMPLLSRRTLTPLAALRRADRVHCGTKAAHLGALGEAVRRGQLQGVAPVPDGYCIPFSAYADFMAQPAARAAVARAEQTPGFATERKVRNAALARLRETLVALPVPVDSARAWVQRWRSQLGGAGVFVRSSSNSEDMPRFSGAGLYSTVPNVTRADALETAVKTVWASVFNAEAYEARRWARIPHDRVVMAVLVQRAVDAQSSGVMVTVNPFDPLQRGVSYLSAKRGLGMRVVEGRRVAEQVLFNPRSGAVQVLSRSDDEIALLLQAQGGVREQAVTPGRAVLTDALVRELAAVGAQIKAVLGPATEQDIEWAVDAQGRIHVLQARPYIDRALEAALR
ncbi:MAG: PEP/pyruvate-binding domain-containing protein [Pseudomonadota bacterium]